MRKYFFPIVAVAALSVLALSTEQASAQRFTTVSVGYGGYGYAPAYGYGGYGYAPAYSYGYGYAPAYSYGYGYAPAYRYGYGGYGRGYGWGGGRGYGWGGRRVSGFSVGVGPFQYSSFRFGGGRRWR